MRLSEAILLGSTVLKPQIGTEFSPGNMGCARGMALQACGIGPNWAKANCEVLTSPFWFAQFLKIWPWTDEIKIISPCRCGISGRSPDTIAWTISHLFDHHVAGHYIDMTLEQLVDWVRSVEPPDLEELLPLVKEKIASILTRQSQGI